MNLKFTYSHHETVINFLDITLIGTVEQGVVISPYRKDMARNSTLLATSCHPEHVVHNIPVGELICTRRNCTENNKFHKKQKKVCDRLRSRGYPEWMLQRARY